MDNLDHSGFAFDTIPMPMEFETLDSKTVTRIAKIIPHEIRRKFVLLDEEYKEKRTVLTGRQMTHQIFSST